MQSEVSINLADMDKLNQHNTYIQLPTSKHAAMQLIAFVTSKSPV